MGFDHVKFLHLVIIVDLTQQINHGQVQGPGDFLDIAQRNIARATLDPADIGAVQVNDLGQLFLRIAPFSPYPLQILGQDPLQTFHRPPTSDLIVAVLSPMSLHSMSHKRDPVPFVTNPDQTALTQSFAGFLQKTHEVVDRQGEIV